MNPSSSENPGRGPTVVESWARSTAAGVAADDSEPLVTLSDAELRDARKDHPLSQVFPMLDDVLGRAARDCDAIMAVADEAGQLLWVCGAQSTLRRAEKIGFVEGSNWDERVMGTNAPGLALRTGQASSVIRVEHFRRSVRDWSCAASPIHDPGTGRLLGVLDITGGDSIVVPQTMALVRAAARMAESELALGQLHPRAVSHTGRSALTFESMGRSESVVRVDDGRGQVSDLRLSRRHSEICVLLASAPRGMSGDELAVLLYEDANGASTLRAEMNRLRNLLGDDFVASRPYRLVGELAADWLKIDAHLDAGRVAEALREYRGPLLPRSYAPGVERIRERLENRMRSAILASRDLDLMSAWTRTSWGADDYAVWEAQRSTLAAGSPLRRLVDGQLARLDREYGI